MRKKMASNDDELFICSICLQLMEDPVTIGCGHNYCMRCIDAYWNRRFPDKAAFSCPQCRHTFTPRPALFRNALLAELLEAHITEAGAGGHGADPGGAEEEEEEEEEEEAGVLCDVCTGKKKRNACKFCLICLVSYCHAHLTPHLEVPPLQKHELVRASPNTRHVICARHNKLLELYCRTERVFMCALCVVEGHQSHHTVAVSEEMKAEQMQLQRSKDNIVDMVMDSERRIIDLKEAAISIKGTAWEVCDEFERLCHENTRLYISAMEKKCADVRERVGEVEKAGLDWTNAQLGLLRSEVTALKKKDRQLAQLLLTEEPIQFIKGFQAFGGLPASNDVHTRMKKLTEFVSSQKHKLKNVCNADMGELCTKLTQYTALSVPREKGTITTRQFFLTKYKNQELEMDPNSVAACLSLSCLNRELSWGASDQAHPDHSDRFTYYPQALCKQGLTGNSYWEVEWDGGVVEVAVSYKGINRKGSGNDCCFGHNNLSWKLVCCSSGCRFWHNNLERAHIPPASICKISVHLKYQEGILSFYSINTNDELTLLHETQVLFTEPLYPGFSVDLGSTLKISTI